MVIRSTRSREGFKYVPILVCVYTRIVHRLWLWLWNEANIWDAFTFHDFKRHLRFQSTSAVSTRRAWLWEQHRASSDGLQRSIYGSPLYALRLHQRCASRHDLAKSVFSVHCWSCHQVHSQNDPCISVHLQTIEGLVVCSNEVCHLRDKNRLPHPPHKSPIEAFSGKLWGMWKLCPFECMCHYHVLKFMRGSSVVLNPTLTAGLLLHILSHLINTSI